MIPSYDASLENFLLKISFASEFSENTFYSMPVLVKRSDLIFDALFLYQMDEVEEEGWLIQRPFAWGMFSFYNQAEKCFCWCAAQDFISQEEYPLGSMATSQPIALSDSDLQEEGIALYNALRDFAFETDLTPAQLDIQRKYCDLFFRLCYDGLYPFYYALSPEFFQWLGMDAPDGLLKEWEQEGYFQPKTSNEITFPTADLELLLQQLQERLEQENLLHQQVEALHEEVQQYRNGFMEGLCLPLERDIILLLDTMRKSFTLLDEVEQLDADYTRLLDYYNAVKEDLEDILYRQGVDPYTVEGESVVIPRQKVLKTIPTDNPKLDKTVAARLAPGWEKGERIIRPEYIAAYLYEQIDTEQSESDTEIPDEE